MSGFSAGIAEGPVVALLLTFEPLTFELLAFELLGAILETGMELAVVALLGRPNRLQFAKCIVNWDLAEALMRNQVKRQGVACDLTCASWKRL